MTFHYNLPSLLELQIKTIEKFCRDDFELIVFNDASDPELATQLTQVCNKSGVQCVRYKQKWHENHPLTRYIHQWLHDPTYQGAYLGLHKNAPMNEVSNCPSLRHAHVMQYALDHFGYQHDGPVIILDGDALLIRPISFNALLKKRYLVGSQKQKGDASYIWVPIIAINMPKIPEKKSLKFHPDVINFRLYDTGSHSHYYLQKHNSSRIRACPFYSITHLKPSQGQIDSLNLTAPQKELIKEILLETDSEFHLNFHVIHLVGSSWMNFESKKKQLVFSLIKSVLHQP
ncbi:MAG: hypothetical protein MRY21_02380 [Simkaniaceae bacterium]|nr:hypothetical protein [Simkaniaceae bacterium]